MALRLFDFPLSGNGYKVRLLLSHLKRSYEYIPVDILEGEAKTAAFLAMNPRGRVPVLELDDGSHLAESNAILYWLSQGSEYWPAERLPQARAMEWLFFEQSTHMPNIGGARFLLTIQKTELTPSTRETLQMMQARGEAALRIMEQHLGGHEFMVAERFSITDIALYAYTHMAEEGGVKLSAFPSIVDWLQRVETQPGHVPIRKWTAA